MSQKVEVVFGLSDVVKGVDTIGSAVGSTMGALGRVVMVPQSYGGPRFTKDGKTVADSAKDLEDTKERYGAMAAYQVAQATQDESGDGTSTSVVILNAAAKEGLKCVTAGMNPVLIKEGMKIAERAISEELGKMSQK